MKDTQDSIVLGGGCFWCLDAGYRLIDGVINVVSGYAGGITENPDYYSVASGKTGYAEVVRVVFNPNIIGLHKVLEIFWAMHNPTTLDRQGHDTGPQYRSIILTNSSKQRKIAELSIKEVAKLWDEPIVTQLEDLDKFYEAEPEHQNYFEKHPEMGYCQVIINPKLAKLREKFSARIKK